MLAPICLFTYNRLSETKQTVEALKNNFLASESDLFIISDGAKNPENEIKVNTVRNYIRQIDGFKSVEIIESKENLGLAKSIIDGVSDVINKYKKVIVLEDDLITSTNFLTFMNQCLDYYEKEDKIFSISGFGHKIKLPDDYHYDVFLRGRNYSWGWATWLDRWQTIDWEIKDWDTFKNNKSEIKSFNGHGSDLFKLLKGSIEGKNNSWAIRFGYNQFKQGKFTIVPYLSKIRNDGYGTDATHCKTSYNRHLIRFDQTDKTNFLFTDDMRLIPEINRQLLEYNNIRSRLKTKIFSALIEKNLMKNRSSVEYVHNSN